MAKKCLKFDKGHESTTPSSMNSDMANVQRPIEIHNIIVKGQDKEKILKVVIEKWLVIYKCSSTSTVDVSPETMEPRMQWEDIVKVSKGKNCQSKILYLAQLSFKHVADIKTFPDKSWGSLLLVDLPEDMLKEVLQAEMTRHGILVLAPYKEITPEK